MLLYAVWFAVLVTYCLNRALVSLLPDVLEKYSNTECLVTNPRPCEVIVYWSHL